MTDSGKLYTGISKCAWAYLFLYFDINLNTISLLPSFVGYLLFLSAIKLLQEEERDLILLQPLGVLLALWHGAKWLLSWFGGNPDGLPPFFDLIISLANLYFHFQLLTNLSSIAAKFQSEGAQLDVKLLKYRTMQTIMLTGIMILSNLSLWLGSVWGYISVGMALVYLIAGICLMKALFDLCKSISKPET